MYIYLVTKIKALVGVKDLKGVDELYVLFAPDLDCGAIRRSDAIAGWIESKQQKIRTQWKEQLYATHRYAAQATIAHYIPKSLVKQHNRVVARYEVNSLRWTQELQVQIRKQYRHSETLLIHFYNAA
jgi:hypothetical protein